MLRDIELIIYDLDGVLIDSSEGICIAFNRVLAEVGEKNYPEDRIREMIGKPLRDMYRKVLPLERQSLVEYCFKRYIEVFKEVPLKHTRSLDRVENTLSYFHKRGLKQSLATTKQSEVADILLKYLNIRKYFDLLLGSNDVRHPKPCPEIIHLTLERLKVNKRNAVFIEDTTIGLEAGKEAGVHTIAVTTGTHSREKLAYLNPDYIVDNISKIKEIIVV